MKSTLAIVGFMVVFVVGCSAPIDDRATALCECYRELHIIDPNEDFELMNMVADSCKALHISILDELSDNPDEKAKFDAAYDYCQNEK
ncbi:MAG: hypothetical protein H6599_09930 [Flavobacteriales bacterium]|nr:hypothetical protein [Flavobacteriales bacterium]